MAGPSDGDNDGHGGALGRIVRRLLGKSSDHGNPRQGQSEEAFGWADDVRDDGSATPRSGPQPGGAAETPLADPAMAAVADQQGRVSSVGADGMTGTATPPLAPTPGATPGLAPVDVPPTLGNDKVPHLVPHIPQITGTGTAHVIEDRVLTAGGKLDIVDPDAGEAAFVAQPSAPGTHGTFSVQPDGTWTYQLDNSQPAVQQLGRGEHLSDLLIVTSVDGTRHALTVEIRGLIDSPVVTVTATQGTDHATATASSGSATLTATEDQPIALGIAASLVDTDPTEHLGAGLTIDGVPPGAMLNHGSADPSHPGRWSLARADLSGLELTPPKDFTGPITLKVADIAVDLSPGEGRPLASAEATLHIDVTPVQDIATIGGKDTGSVTEDMGLHAGQLRTGGALTITDVDAGEAAFTPVSGPAGAGTYGHFTLDAGGNWTYTADNAQHVIDQLGPKDSLTDRLTVTSVDGTSHDITVTISGRNDNPVITTAVRPTDGSVTEDNPAHVTATGTMVAADVDNVTGDLTWSVVRGGHGAFGHVTIDPHSGQWTYMLDNAKAATQQLGAGQTEIDQVQIGVRDPQGGFALRTLHIAVHGTNDTPVITVERIDTDTGAVTEDTGPTTASGTLSVTDEDGIDPVSSLVWTVDPGTAATYGTLSVDPSGRWTYTLDNTGPATQALTAGAPATEHLRVIVTDPHGAQASHDVTVTVTGTPDGAAIAGADTATVTEDTGVTGGNLMAGGTLTITDPDPGEAAFTPVTGAAGSSGYGMFTLAADGHWSYTTDNSQAAIQQLGPRETLTDTLTVIAIDGTTHDITVTIEGSIDTPTLGATVATAVSTPGHAVAEGTGTGGHETLHATGFVLHSFDFGEAYEAADGRLVDLSGRVDEIGVGRSGTAPSIGVGTTGTTFGSHGQIMSFSDNMIDSIEQTDTTKPPEKGETMVMELQGLTRSAHVTLAAFGGQGDALKWTVYDADGHPVDTGTMVADSVSNPSGVGMLSIETTTPFAYIAIEATTPPVHIDPTSGSSQQFHTNFGVAQVQAELVQFSTPLTLQGALGDVGDPDEALTWRVEGLQQASLSAGTRNADGSWTVTEADLPGLAVLHAGHQQITVTAVAIDAGTGATAESTPQTLTLDPRGAHYTVITGAPVAIIDEDGTAPLSGDFDIDTDKAIVPTFVAGSLTGHYGTFDIDADGQWTFHLDTARAQEVRSDGFQEKFQVTTTDGATKDVTVQIHGDDDLAVVTETGSASTRAPAPVVGGQLTASDVDTPGSFMFMIDGGKTSADHASQSLDGTYGTLSIDLRSGAWSYTVDPAEAAKIPPGHTMTESFDLTAIQMNAAHFRTSTTIDLQVDSAGNAVAITPVPTHDAPDQDVIEDATFDVSPAPVADPADGTDADTLAGHGAVLDPKDLPDGTQPAGTLGTIVPDTPTDRDEFDARPGAAEPAMADLDPSPSDEPKVPLPEPAVTGDDPLSHYLDVVGYDAPSSAPPVPSGGDVAAYLESIGVDPAEAVPDMPLPPPDAWIDPTEAGTGGEGQTGQGGSDHAATDLSDTAVTDFAEQFAPDPQDDQPSG